MTAAHSRPDAYQQGPDRIERYSRRVDMAEIEKNNFNLVVSRYFSMAIREVEVDLQEINTEPVTLEQVTKDARDKHNAFFKELGLPALP
jgi:type I restriction enzyme M protein